MPRLKNESYEREYKNIDVSKKEKIEKVSLSSSTNFSLLSIVFVIMLLALLLYKFGVSSNEPTFTSLLTYLSNSSSTITNPFTLNTIPTIQSDWGIVAFLGDFLNLFINVFNIIIFGLGALWNALQYLLYFLGWFFN